MRTQFCENYFFGEEKNFAKPRIWFSRAQEGSGEECARDFGNYLFSGGIGILSDISFSYCPWSKGMHPRHPPRAFPLGLLAPRCLSAVHFLALPTCGRELGHRSCWGEERILSPTPPRLGRARPTVVANPTPCFHLRVYLKILEFCIFVHGGAHPLVMAARRGNARGSNSLCTWPALPFACISRSQGQEGCERGFLDRPVKHSTGYSAILINSKVTDFSVSRFGLLRQTGQHLQSYFARDCIIWLSEKLCILTIYLHWLPLCKTPVVWREFLHR